MTRGDNTEGIPKSEEMRSRWLQRGGVSGQAILGTEAPGLSGTWDSKRVTL